MLIVALVLAVISLAALVTAVMTSNELIAWACIGLSALGVLLLIGDAIRDRNRRAVADVEPERRPAVATALSDEVNELDQVDERVEVVELSEADEATELYDDIAVEDYPDELVDDDPEHDLLDDDDDDAADDSIVVIYSSDAGLSEDAGTNVDTGTIVDTAGTLEERGGGER